jgi:hypothetical protein
VVFEPFSGDAHDVDEVILDGFLAGLPYEHLLPALRTVNVNPLEEPVVEPRSAIS